jgi:benzoyl-CoA reductase/2-hydroxyglutaryl-CoA dehydratase subunit BcrC/BadD/HgdB
VGLCGTRQDPIPAAEAVLPRNLCPLIKSSYGFAVTDTCPFFRFSDLIVGDTTCDGKKKMFELLGQYRPVHVLQLPQNQDRESALPFWHREIVRLKSLLEGLTGNTITTETLREAIASMNRERRVSQSLMDLAKRVPAPISGMDLLTVTFKTGFFADREQGLSLMRQLAARAGAQGEDHIVPAGRCPPRILLTGVPVGLGWKRWCA